jgi:bifunctional UDP-N-acetylglucosamine pyrophosphorylase/glucosamine-1-phosphate N-acetyltransferase
MAVADGVPVETCQPINNTEILGINDRQNLSDVERIYQQQQANRYLQAGLSVCDPARFDIRGSLKHGKDCFIDINVIIEGEVTLGDRVSIGPNTLLRNMTIDDDVEVKANCILDRKYGSRFSSIIGSFRWIFASIGICGHLSQHLTNI